jgi:hypothetical protein
MLSELYYRNNAGISYADTDLHKEAPAPLIYSSNGKKIPGTQILNRHILDKLRDEYGL